MPNDTVPIVATDKREMRDRSPTRGDEDCDGYAFARPDPDNPGQGLDGFGQPVIPDKNPWR